MLKLLFTFALSLQALHSQELIFRQVADTKTDTYVEVMSLFSHPSLGGYHPVRVIIANNQKTPHKLFLNFKVANGYGDPLSTTSSYSFFAAPGKTVTNDILVPLGAQNGVTSYQSLETSLGGSMGNTTNTQSAIFSPEQANVLLSESLYTPNASTLDTELISRGGSSSGGGTKQFSSKFDPKRLPDDWRAYSGFDSLLMTETDWSATPPGPRNGILSWLRLGGQLVIYSSTLPTLESLGIPADQSFGQALIRPLTPDLRLNPVETVDLTHKQRLAKHRMAAITDDFNSTWPIQKDFGEKSFNYIFFVIILSVFGILVGPVNLFVFANASRRHRLFITTPIISLATSLLLIVMIILQDGFGGRGTRLVLMEVRPDANQNAAFIHQEQFSRTGVMTSPSFTLDTPALIAPVPLSQSRWARFTNDYKTNGNYDIQPASGKVQASGDWFQSRSEQGQLITAVVPTRGRIEPTKQPDTLISTFDFPIQTLLYKDPKGAWHRADNITKGQPIKLASVDPTLVLPLLNAYASKFTERNQTYFQQVDDRNDHFVAITDQAPAIDTHPGIRWTTTTLITGPLAR